MSVRHPIISVTGSSGAGTTTVKHTFEQIFRREGIDAALIEGDAFHRYDRAEMRRAIDRRPRRRATPISATSARGQPAEELEAVFARVRARRGTGRTRHYVHDEREASAHGSPPGTFTDWADFRPAPTCCSTRACTARW